MITPLPIVPRGLSRELAAIYVGITADRFDQLVRAGQMPAAKNIAGIVVWDRFEIDAAFTAIGAVASTQNESEARPMASAVKDATPSKPPQVPNAYSPKSLAQRWLCSERTIRNMAERGDLPFFRLGGSLLRIKREDVETYEGTAGLEPVMGEALPETPMPPLKRERLQRLDLNQLRPLRGPRKKPS